MVNHFLFNIQFFVFQFLNASEYTFDTIYNQTRRVFSFIFFPIPITFHTPASNHPTPLYSPHSILHTLRTVRGSNPGGGEIFRTRPNRHWGPSSLLYNWYRVSIEVKRPERADDHPPQFIAEVKERVGLYLYTLYGPSWPVLW
jgi:hypothetical protein